LIQISDISFPRNRKGSVKPLKTLWESTVGVQSPSTLATEGFGIVRKEGLSIPVRAFSIRNLILMQAL